MAMTPGNGETPDLHKGHGTAALGPSDTSDSGSDIVGGPGFSRVDQPSRSDGTASDTDIEPVTAGADIGDTDLDSDSDSAGTGERAAAGRDSILPVDTILRDEQDRVVDAGKVDDRAGSGKTLPSELAARESDRDDPIPRPANDER